MFRYLLPTRPVSGDLTVGEGSKNRFTAIRTFRKSNRNSPMLQQMMKKTTAEDIFNDKKIDVCMQ
jgi:hypothetical protein